MSTFINDIDKDKMNDLLNETEVNSVYFDDIVSKVESGYIKDLDDLMLEISNALDEPNAPTELLETYMQKLSSLIYFIGSRIEFVGIREDVSKAMQKEVYNRAYIENDIETVNDAGKKVKPTKDANVAYAEEKSKYQNVLNAIYDRTYKILKFKVDAAFEKLGSIKKVLNRRIQEIDPRG